MGLTVHWTEPAWEEFAERLDYIGAMNPDAARRLRRRVDGSLHRLLEFPEIGLWVPEFGLGFYREILVKPLRLMYEIQGGTLAVTHVQRQEEVIFPDSFDFDEEGRLG